MMSVMSKRRHEYGMGMTEDIYDTRMQFTIPSPQQDIWMMTGSHASLLGVCTVSRKEVLTMSGVRLSANSRSYDVR